MARRRIHATFHRHHPHRSVCWPVSLIASQPALALKLLTEENPPLNYTEGKKLTGMGTEVVQEMGKRAGMNLDFEVMAWNKAYEKAQADKETCLYSTARLPNRENAFKWVGPIAVNKWGLFALGGFTPTIKSLADARPFRIGGVARDAKTEFLKQYGVTNIVEVEDDKLNPGKLTLNRKEAQKIDLWITSVANAKQVAARPRSPTSSWSIPCAKRSPTSPAARAPRRPPSRRWRTRWTE